MASPQLDFYHMLQLQYTYPHVEYLDIAELDIADELDCTPQKAQAHLLHKKAFFVFVSPIQIESSQTHTVTYARIQILQSTNAPPGTQVAVRKMVEEKMDYSSNKTVRIHYSSSFLQTFKTFFSNKSSFM